MNDLDEASSVEAARKVLSDIKEELSDIQNDHAIWPYYDYAVNQHVSIFEQIIPKFSLIIGSDTAHDDVEQEVKGRLMLPDESSQDLVVNELGGWFQRTVMEAIKSGKPAIVYFSELKKHISVLLSQIRLRELVDFAAKELVVENKADPLLSDRPVFVQQLDLINLTEDLKLQAVTDFLRAEYNRNKWIENEFIDEQTASDFENKLQTFWETEQRKAEILYSSLPEEKRGQLILAECIARQETIRNASPPDRTVAGTYHALADSGETLGWHPRWDNLLHKNDGAENE